MTRQKRLSKGLTDGDELKPFTRAEPLRLSENKADRAKGTQSPQSKSGKVSNWVLSFSCPLLRGISAN